LRRLRVAVLCHAALVPPDRLAGLDERAREEVETEWDVARALRAAGHEVRFVGLADSLAPLDRLVERWRPHAVVNLLMEFAGEAALAAHVVAHLELRGVAVTGCDARGLLLTRDKALAKTILRHHGLPTPDFAVHPRGRRAARAPRLRFPLIVKALDEEASRGIAQASVVRSAARLRERVAFVHRRVGCDAIAEEYVEGRELTVGVLGNARLTVLPAWELRFARLPARALPIATERAKFDPAHRRRIGVRRGRARGLSAEAAAELARLARRAYRALGLSGHARLDLRLDRGGRPQLIEVNAAPDLAAGEDLAASAAAAGIPYPRLLERILALALARRARGAR
jgi:D-alanine-D-alanine ligase